MTKEPKKKKAEKPKKKKEEKISIPLIPIPDDAQELEDEMKELFQEDQVTHRHGGTEPERD